MVGDELKRLDGPIFITGHTGFKGSWLSLLLNHLGVEHFGYSLEAEEDSLYKRANLERVSSGVVGDIRDLENLSKIVKDVRPSVIIHLAAQPIVLKSYQEPLQTFQTNCIGTANILTAASETPSVEIVLVITTDKVYRNDNTGRRFIESDSLEGKDPYSASKVAAEAVCVAWQQINKTLGGPKIIVARTGNVIGGGDFAAHRLIPDIIRGVLHKKPIEIRNLNSTRPWQHVLDPLSGYLSYIERVLSAKTSIGALNFGPFEASLKVSEVIELGRTIFGNHMRIVISDKAKGRESNVLELDASLANKELSWSPNWSQSMAAINTFKWWHSVLANENSAFDMCVKDVFDLLNTIKL